MTFEDPITPEQEAEIRVESKKILERDGLPPEHVGRIVVDAVRENRFWVLPHPEYFEHAKRKWEDPEAWIRSRTST